MPQQPLAAIVQALDALTPPALAEPWDNVGLLCGDPKQTIARVVLCIDWTQATADEAESLGPLAETLVLAYHPPWFAPLKRLPHGTPLARALRAGAAIYSPHTALDAVAGGTNDVLAEAAGVAVGDARPLLPAVNASPPRLRLAVAVPPAAAEALRASLCRAGAGTIGEYTGCSFSLTGEGTFVPGKKSSPATGERGVLAREAEILLVTWLPASARDAVVAALRESHPYEEPVFDFFASEPLPDVHAGQGRHGPIAPAPFAQWLHELKRGLQADGALVGLGEGRAPRPVAHVAVAAGAGRSCWQAARFLGADTFVTGELPHHDALAAVASGLRVVCLRHSVSERSALAPLANKLRQLCAGVLVVGLRRDVDPYQFA